MNVVMNFNAVPKMQVSTEKQRRADTVKPRYNDVQREQWNEIDVKSRYRYIETPNIKILP